jgi:hypothetical protein
MRRNLILVLVLAATNAIAAAVPDTQKLSAHLADHVKYPASRTAVLAACADTPEFGAEEKRWLSSHLPEGSYASAFDVLKAVGLRAELKAPDIKKLRDHLNSHASYPVTRSQLLAACAETPEFSAEEKAWIASRLPEGKYGDAAAVAKALKLE